MMAACERPRVAAGDGDDLDFRFIFIRIHVGASLDIRQHVAVRRKMRIPHPDDAREIGNCGNSPVTPCEPERQEPEGNHCRNGTCGHTHPSLLARPIIYPTRNERCDSLGARIAPWTAMHY